MESQIISDLNEIKRTVTLTGDPATRLNDPALQKKRTLSSINKVEIYRQVRQASVVLSKALAIISSCTTH